MVDSGNYKSANIIQFNSIIYLFMYLRADLCSR
jgi:hypothetical protein